MRALLTACFSALLLALPATGAWAATWAAGGFTFSDELGGFRLISVSGTGTANDPLVIVEEIEELLPVTLVIRKGRLESPKDATIPGQAFVNLAVIKVVINTSSRVWGAFDLELQEVLKEPSPYGDGLSFDQMRGFDEVVSSDSFASSRQVYEPYDRVRFQDGSVDPGATVRFSFRITDPTPVGEFYLLQQPRLLMAGPWPRGPSFARR